MHDESAEEASATLKKVLEEKETAASSPVHSLRATYLKVARSDPCQFYTPLPTVPSLPVRKCLQCPTCSYIAWHPDTIRKHVTSCGSEKKLDLSLHVSAQTIFSGKKRRFFQCDNTFDGGDVSREEPTSKFLRVVKFIEGQKPSNVRGLDVAQMDAYLSEMRFDEHLSSTGLTLKKAHRALFWREDEEFAGLRKLLSTYLKRAFDTSKRKLHIKAHRFLEAPLQLAVSEETMRKYSRLLNRFLSFLCGMSQHTEVPNILPEHHCLSVPELGKVSVLEAERLKMLHALMKSVPFDELENGENSIPLFLSRDAVIMAPDGSFRFGTASKTSHTLAALKNLARTTVVTEVYVYEKDRTAAWKWVEAATAAHSDTEINIVSFCLKLSNRVRSTETHRSRFVVCPRHERCGIIDGNEIPISILGAKMRGLQRDTWSVLQKEVLNGLDITDTVWKMCRNLQDAIQDRTTGYWFGMHSAYYTFLYAWREKFFDKLRPSLFDGDTLRRKEGMQFLDSCEKLQSILSVLVQVCSGAPARATELGVVKFCNTAAASRNVFISQGQLVISVYFDKSRSMHDGVGKPIARYTDSVTAGLLPVYLCVVRPIECAVIQELLLSGDVSQENLSATEHRDFIFSRRGLAASPDCLRNWFASVMDGIQIQIGNNQYRQYHVGVLKNFLKAERHCDPDGTFMLHNQAGHTPGTAHRIYGVSSGDMKSLTGAELEAFRIASEVWQNVIGLTHGCPGPLSIIKDDYKGTGMVK